MDPETAAMTDLELLEALLGDPRAAYRADAEEWLLDLYQFDKDVRWLRLLELLRTV